MVDLHVHSTFSDGTDTPGALIAGAEAAGLTAIALTDHNTAAGLPDFLAAGGKSTVEAVAGVELSADYRGTELHILALFLTPEVLPAVNARTEAFRREKAQSSRALAARLAAGGYDVSYEEAAQRAGGYVNRAHIAALLTEKGYVPSIQAAFKTLLRRDGGYYVPPALPDAFETIRFIRSIGAVPVLAHPLLNLDEEALRAFLPMAVEAGLLGMEAAYPRYDAAGSLLARAVAEEFGLAPSGGSDYHGANKPDIRLGTGTGTLAVPDAWFYRLKAFSAL